MKIRIEGCTAEELAAKSPYLSLGKVYDVEPAADRPNVPGLCRGKADDGDPISILVGDFGYCAFLPLNARWVEVSE